MQVYFIKIIFIFKLFLLYLYINKINIKMTYDQFKEQALNLHISKVKIPLNTLNVNDNVLKINNI